MADENKIGQRLLATLLDELARKQPTRRFATIPKTANIDDGFVDISIADLANAVNYMAGWIQKNLGCSSDHASLAYLGANDVRYFVFILACSKTGYKAFLPSPRNSDESFLHLFKVTETNAFLYGAERRQKMSELGALRPDMKMLEIPSLSDMLIGSDVFPYDAVYEKVEDDVLFIIHSSGTTGLPKPVPITHGFMSTIDRSGHFPFPPGRQCSMGVGLEAGDLVLTPGPFFHLMGLYTLIRSLFEGIPVALFPDRPLSTDLFVQTIRHTKPKSAMCPPSILEEMCASPAGLEALSTLDSVAYGGAPLSPEVGDKLSQVTNIQTGMGSSEAGVLMTMAPLVKEDWAYYEWNPFYKTDMQPVGEGMYELVIPRCENRDIHGIFHTYPELHEYRTKDLFTAHPTKPGLWKFAGRYDDVIVLSNGEKFNPVSMEKVIEGHDVVARAAVVGQGRFQAALLIEPNWSVWKEGGDIVEMVWPSVQKANQAALAHGRIMKSKIAVLPRGQYFRTTPKGTVQRLHVGTDFGSLIDALYAGDESEQWSLPENTDIDSICEFVSRLVSEKLDSDINAEDDIFVAGLDSLQTIQLAKDLQGAIRLRFPERSIENVTSQQIYANPTIQQLSTLVYRTIHGQQDGMLSRKETIEGLVRKYTASIPTQEQHHHQQQSQMRIVILTGSTGSLGSYILSSLLSNHSVEKIFCLNRSDAAKRQEQGFIEKGLNPDFERVEFLNASFGHENFGLDADKYKAMTQTVDTIIHNAWQVNFNHGISSFEKQHIHGMRRFIDFSLQSAQQAHIHFISSIGTVGGWNKFTHGPSIPEVPLEDCDVVIPQGYGESKHVAERICLEASRRAGVQTTIYRVGQIAGPTTQKGAWNRQEWLPTLVKTSKAVGAVPDTLGPFSVDWIPVDTLANIITELITSRHTSSSNDTCTVFHLANPSITSWESLIPAVEKSYTVKPSSLSSWIQKLEGINNPTEEDVIAMPAIKLLDFYRGVLAGEGSLSTPLELVRTMQASSTMRRLKAIDVDLMLNWIQQWEF
ncbi:hypothetical protein ASPWEDRAFT_144517 [Aspergillus wentii DTO 134E9]|uniref:Carrier domain-containing protein n=1 Tax=Aspergillus wentii DTO 134E9 TaxID=1073089 RepID=A0A1L9RYR1_ASPWE|nr:uncharacterized protein ASPWEDRAFT_144517 [Aspergillus wentii DTO 134E9]KAI9932541.1 hypothetical protein MW887_008783 [Aspergillus wentii]OJJ40106.1 hypothetical protein ASPWEDRAFT_144517 [Aspergillus wentii DTO 134E9]